MKIHVSLFVLTGATAAYYVIIGDAGWEWEHVQKDKASELKKNYKTNSK